jgi:hydroxyacylglutathione hydrolase
MLQNFNVIKSLPLNMLIFCGHEYSVQNLSFGLSVETENRKLKDKRDECVEFRKLKKPCIPSTLEDELEINVFMRCNVQGVQKILKEEDEVLALKKLRKMKDEWKP